MALSYPELTPITQEIIDAAIEVHSHLGPGLLEAHYEHCLCVELQLKSIYLEAHPEIPIVYKGRSLGSYYRPDLVIEGRVIVELKSVEKTLPVHKAQVLTYMRLMGIKVGLLINFNTAILTNGITRLSL